MCIQTTDFTMDKHCWQKQCSDLEHIYHYKYINFATESNSAH